MAPAPFASVHVCDLASLSAAVAWRRRLERQHPGVVWLKAMTPIGSARSGGFSAGVPRLSRQLVVAAWSSRDAFDDVFATASCTRAWHALLVPYRARGTHRGPVPFAPAADGPGEGPMAALTLGRTTWPRALPFALEGARLARSILGAPGLVTAVSAGFPPAGNATFSIWKREEDMLAFAYRKGAPHREVVARSRRFGLLEEQIAVRFRVAEIRGTPDAP